MYCQLTTRCNMTCAHCCFSCTSKGKDMTKQTFEATIKLAVECDSLVTLGGGEPTIHPQFIDFLIHSIAELGAYADDSGIHVITNGSIEKPALLLAKLARSGVISAELSRDQFHSKIEDSIIKAFTNPNQGKYWLDKPSHDQRGVRSKYIEPRQLLNVGRARKNQLTETTEPECSCQDLFITPNGNVYHCGCKKKYYGNVNADLCLDEYFEMSGECSRQF